MKKNVYLLGLLSLFNDISADMVAPLLPAYLLSLGAGAPLLGVMEGLANTLSHVTVLFSGYYSDRHLKTKKITVLGYRLCSVVRVLIAFPLLPVIVSARLLDRIGKGIRTAPRDRLLISSVPEKEWGKAFGIQRALDHTGSLLAPLISSFLISIFALSYTKLFLIAAIPSLIAVLIIPRLIQEVKEPLSSKIIPEATPRLTWKHLHPSLKKYVGIIFLSSLSTPSELFLIFKMQKLGVTLGEVPMVWFVLTLFTLMASYFGGLTAGWFGKRWTIILGWSIFALVYVGFAYSYTLSICWVLVAVYGVHLGLIESSERVIAASLVNSHQRASAMGWYYFAYGIGALPASLLFGFFWNHVSDKFAFLWNAGLTCVAIVLFLIWLNPRKGLHDLSA